MFKRKTVTVLGLSSLVLLLALGRVACDLVQRAHQVRSFADLQIISGRVRFLASPEPTDAQIIEIMHSLHNGIDAWGNAYTHSLERREGKTHLILISTGADGSLDLPEPADYLNVSQVDIRGTYDHDIVFIDGLPITLAGK